MGVRKGNPFNEQHVRYEAWFTHHETAYYSELLAIRAFLPGRGSGLEIGVGTGRFAGPLGVQVGVDPSGAMLAYAVERGITGAQGMAEMLPFKEEVFDYALVVTTLCFVQDPMRMLAEAHRVLKPEAPLVIGFVDRASELGQHYLSHQSENVFYREAKFYSASEVGELLRDTGFHEQIWAQTLSKPLGQIQEIEPFREGLGSGGFVVVKAIRRRSLAAKEGEQFHRSGDLTDLENISHRDVDGFSRRAKEAEQKITILYEITRFVSSLLDVQLVLDAIVNLLVEEFNLDACSIRLLDADGKLRIKSQKGLSKAFIEQAAREPTVDCYSGDCFLTGRITIINDADRIDKPISTNRIVCENIKSFALTPIRVEGETIGVLVTSSKKKDYFHERFNDVIYVISNQIGIAIRISQLYEQIHALNEELEQRVRERTAELEEKTRCLLDAERLATVGEMSERIAHELRNSLTVVGGLARRLHEKSSKNDLHREYLKVIFEEVKTLEEKVSNLIRLGAGG